MSLEAICFCRTIAQHFPFLFSTHLKLLGTEMDVSESCLFSHLLGALVLLFTHMASGDDSLRNHATLTLPLTLTYYLLPHLASKPSR